MSDRTTYSDEQLQNLVDGHQQMHDGYTATLHDVAKELLEMRAARAADAERVRSVVREALESIDFGKWSYYELTCDPTEVRYAIAARAAEQLAGAGGGRLRSIKLLLSGMIADRKLVADRWARELALLDRLLASPPAHSEPTYGQKRRTRAQLVALIGENAADNYISFPDNLNEPTDHAAAICTLLDSDMPAGDLRKALAELVGRR